MNELELGLKRQMAKEIIDVLEEHTLPNTEFKIDVLSGVIYAYISVGIEKGRLSTKDAEQYTMKIARSIISVLNIEHKANHKKE